MSFQGDWRDVPPSELEVEQQRAGVHGASHVADEEFQSPLSVGGLGAGGSRYGEPSAEESAADPGSDPEHG